MKMNSHNPKDQDQSPTKTRLHFDANHIPYDSQPETINAPTHVLGDDGNLKPINKEKFKPSDMTPMDYGANYGVI